MILLIDIGNTTIVAGGMQDGDLLFADRFPTHGEDLRTDILNLLKNNGAAPEMISGAALTSVVPEAAGKIQEALTAAGIEEILVVSSRTDTGLSLEVDRPETVGTDMIVGAFAAASRYGTPVIMIDMGTATTFSAVNEKKQYLGHVIMPGVGISLEALLNKTAQLPPIELEVPPHIIGKNTKNAMQSGVLYGNAAMTDGMIDRILQAYGWEEAQVKIVATGGLSKLIMPLCRHEIISEPDLLLRGLYEIYLRNITKEQNK